jgi:hypothetical protein
MKPSRIKNVVLTGLLVAFPAFLTGCPPEAQIVTFPDENLEVAVRSALRQPFGFVTVAGMRTLTQLSAPDFGITDLRGLENATGLLSLDLSYSEPTDISISNIEPIADLKDLSFLNLENNTIADITPLAALYNLDQLFLAGNEVYNLTALRANASGPPVGPEEDGGLGPGDTVTLNGATLFDENGPIGPQVGEDIEFLLAQGVDVIIITDGAVIEIDDAGMPVSKENS